MTSLALRDVTKHFGSTMVLNNINLEVEDGEFLVLVGPSGCGKTTLLNIIAGLEVSTDGDILIGDRRVNDATPKTGTCDGISVVCPLPNHDSA